jgi:hypothetical protein
VRREDIFEKLSPPPGGLAKLRGRLEVHDGHPWARIGGLTAVVVAVGLILVLGRRSSFDVVAAARFLGGPSEVGLGLAPPPEAPLTLTDEAQRTSAITRVPSSDPRVTMYLVGTLP